MKFTLAPQRVLIECEPGGRKRGIGFQKPKLTC